MREWEQGKQELEERLDAGEIDALLREALIARARRLGLNPETIASPSPGALFARTLDGAMLRVDVSTYTATELRR